MHHVSGTFDVTLKPEALSTITAASGLSRMSINKVFHGGLEGTSKGEMLSAGNPAMGSAGYVAIEQVTGRLDGLEGSFALQHSATIHAGTFTLNITVVPGSGTGALKDISGKLDLQIEKGKHSYTFDYTLPVS